MTYEEANELASKMKHPLPQVYEAFVKEKITHDCSNCTHQSSCSFQKFARTMNRCNYFVDNSKMSCHKVTLPSSYRYVPENE